MSVCGIDVWCGSLSDRQVTGVTCTVDLNKKDAELKLLLGCTPDEARHILCIHNNGQQSGLLILRAYDQFKLAGEFRDLQHTGFNGKEDP